MRLFVSGSAPLLAETHREWQARTGHAILERYGMTETSMNTSNPYERRAHRRHRRASRCRASRSASPTRRPARALGAGEIGMIEVRGPNVFKGYWRMPEKTAAEFREDGFFITGDLGKIDAQRLRPHRRPRQGPDHHRRLQRLSEGGRERDRRDRRRRRERRHRPAASRFRRGRHRRRGDERRGRADRDGRARRRSRRGSRGSSCRSG